MIAWQPVDENGSRSEAPADPVTPARVPLGRLLIDGGFISQHELDDALYEGSRTGERLGEIVVARGLATEDDVARLLAEQWGLEYVDRTSIWFDAVALGRLSREDAQRLEALPTRVENGQVVVAVAEPTEQRLAALRHVIGEETVVIVVPKTALDAGLRSDLLASRGATAEPHVDEVALPPPLYERPPPPLPPQPPPPAYEPPVEEHQPAPEPRPPEPKPPEPEPQAQPPEPEPEPEPPLAPVAELPVRHIGDADADAVVALANEARAATERLAAQAAAVTSRANDQYEARIAALEAQLAERSQQLGQVREQLEALLRAINGSG